ncbi:MAG TPA: DUF4440 domain-containing protein [Longimicrobium sp.]|nr:DUF4440 domain-containing protein [Longimicrobium sp.]
MRTALLLAAALLATASAAPAQRSATRPDSAAALAAHRAWWRAFTLGDTAQTAALATPDLTLTLSTSETFDRAGAVRNASVRGDPRQVRLEWADESARVGGGTAVVTSRFVERIGASESEYRYLTVLRRERGAWRVAAAQSTRIQSPAPSVAVAPEVTAEYAGRYRLPNGGEMRVSARDSMLVLAPAGGAEVLAAPIAPAVFELRSSRARFDLVRFVFERGADGRVARMTRLSPAGAVTFPRIP